MNKEQWISNRFDFILETFCNRNEFDETTLLDWLDRKFEHPSFEGMITPLEFNQDSFLDDFKNDFNVTNQIIFDEEIIQLINFYTLVYGDYVNTNDDGLTPQQWIDFRISEDSELCEYMSDYQSLNEDFKEEFDEELPMELFEKYKEAHEPHCEEGKDYE